MANLVNFVLLKLRNMTKKLAYFWVLPLPKNVNRQYNIHIRRQITSRGISWRKFIKLSAIGYHCFHWRPRWDIENSLICLL